MLMANWTKAQTKAIEVKDKTLLISAAAGSGKTTVLIERIIRLLTDPINPTEISRMLIVTFTRAAAAELKQRISAAISAALAERPNDKRLFKQLSALGSAHISTIDSFYGDVVRSNCQMLGIPSNLRISDDSELTKIRKRIMDEVIDLGYSGELSVSEDDFAALADSLSDMRNDSKLYEIFYDLYNKLQSHPHYIDFLNECADSYDLLDSEDFFDSVYGKVIKEYVKLELEFLIRLLTDALDYFSGYEQAVRAPFEDDLAFCECALEQLNSGNYLKTREFFSTYSPTKLKSPKGDDKTERAEYFLGMRTKIVKEKIKKLQSMYFGAGFSSDELKIYAKGSALRCRTLYAILSKFDVLYKQEKLSLGICEFSDIKLWAYELLVDSNGEPTELAKTLSQSFDCVFIDEYQDVDGVQDLIFKAISKPCGRFMVGDVKQSIYRFRGAEPTLFMNYRNSFAPIDDKSEDIPSDDNCTIFMSENFRCDKTIIDFANKVCSYLFTTASENIDYADEDNLSFSKLVPDGYVPTRVTVNLIDRKAVDVEFENAEAAYIASEINRLINEEKKANGEPITAGDIAVLSRGYAFCAEVQRALDKYGIPHSGGADTNIFDDAEVSLAISLLNVIDNPMRDVHTAAVLLSPLFKFTADMLIKIKGENTEGACYLYDEVCAYASKNDDELSQSCKNFIKVIDELREQTRSMPADRVMAQIFHQFSFLSRSSESGSREALIGLYENARCYEGDTFKGLYSYLKYVDDMIENQISPKASAGESDDGVKLMTIHKSKGLEFPVCFVGGCAKPFNRDDAKDRLLYASGLGIATDLSDQTGFGKIKTPYRKSLSRFVLNESAEEEMRVLYVALTRGRERLYVTADPRYGTDREFALARTYKEYGGRAAILDSNDYLSWVLTALHGENDENRAFDVSVMTYGDIPTLPDKVPSKKAGDQIGDEQIKNSDEIASTIKKNLDYEYPYLHIANLPAKLSVSKLSPNVLDVSEGIKLEDDEAEGLDTKLPRIYRNPSFLSEGSKATSAEKGTATHNFLQFCDFERAIRNGVSNELDRLIERRFIDRSMGELVNIKQIESFLKSPLYAQLSRAKKVYREQRFNILLPASQFTEDAEYAKLIKDEKLLIQGVIDLFFEDEDGKLILCDYKTDFLTSEELNSRELACKKLSERHSRQLSYYAAAINEIFGRKPDEVLIYSLPFGDSFKIEV